MELIFEEENFLVKTLSTHEEMEAAFRLRHDVFSMELKWVPPSSDGMEKDPYDSFSRYLGVFDTSGLLVGHIRIITSEHPFMVEKEFSCMMPEGAKVTKTADVAEITRLCVRKDIRSNQSMACIPNLLYKGLYHWNMGNDVRHSLMVVDKRCFRHLRLSGLPVEQLYDFVMMPDGVKAGVCNLDWRRFEESAPEKKPEFFKWMSILPVRYPSQWLSHALY